MKKPYGIVTATAVLLGTGLAAWWIARTGDEGAGALSVTIPAVAREATGAREVTDGREATRGQAATPVGAGAATATGQGQTPGRTAEQAIVDHNTATRGPRQPIPFSHEFHASELQIDCMYCHAGTERSSRGIVPPLEVCMGCHRVAGAGLEPIEELKGYWERNEQVPWERVNRLPDFVQFSHRPHLRNDIPCARCHGPVEEMDRVYQWAPLTMGWCLDCHRSQPEEGDVATDYRLVRESPPPPGPGGRQEHSLYPLTIDQKYGAFRAPIDCLACHY